VDTCKEAGTVIRTYVVQQHHGIRSSGCADPQGGTHTTTFPLDSTKQHTCMPAARRGDCKTALLTCTSACSCCCCCLGGTCAQEKRHAGRGEGLVTKDMLRGVRVLLRCEA